MPLLTARTLLLLFLLFLLLLYIFYYFWSILSVSTSLHFFTSSFGTIRVPASFYIIYFSPFFFSNSFTISGPSCQSASTSPHFYFFWYYQSSYIFLHHLLFLLSSSPILLLLVHSVYLFPHLYFLLVLPILVAEFLSIRLPLSVHVPFFPFLCVCLAVGVPSPCRGGQTGTDRQAPLVCAGEGVCVPVFNIARELIY